MLMKAGTYLGYIDKAVMAEVGAKKTPAVSITFKVVFVAANGDWERLPADEMRTVDLFMSEGAYTYTEKKLARLGFKGDFNKIQFDDELVAEGVELTCRIEQFEGKDREKWDVGTGGMERTQVAQTVADKFNARWKQNNGAKPSGKPTTPPARKPAPSPVMAGAQSDEIKPEDTPF